MVPMEDTGCGSGSNSVLLAATVEWEKKTIMSTESYVRTGSQGLHFVVLYTLILLWVNTTLKFQGL